MIRNNKKNFALIVFILCSNCQAIGFGEVSEHAMGIANFASDIIHLLSYTLSLIFLLIGIMQYRMHRNNPKVVPLLNVLISFTLSLALFSMPALIVRQEGSSGAYHANQDNNITKKAVSPKDQVKINEPKHWSEQ